MSGAGGAGSERDQVAAALSASRAHAGLVALLLGLTAVAWWITVGRMAGMDAGPGTDLGELGWFVGVWVVMMAAMMLPALAPTAALYAGMAPARGSDRPLLFVAGYLMVWGAAGLAAYTIFEAGKAAFGSGLAWHAGGRWVAGGVLVVAAVYEHSPAKDLCLGRCRSPAAFLLGAWREGRSGALAMGAEQAGWCLGCCWGLMAALFALGVMSVTWMVLIATVITVERVVPWRRAATWATAGLLVVLAAALLAIPRDVPGLVVPGARGPAMHGMSAMP